MTQTASNHDASARQIQALLNGSAAPVLESLEASAQRLVPAFAERAGELDRKRGFPTENFAALRETGLLRMALPREFDGSDASMLDVTKVLHQLARGCPSTALIFNMHLALTGQLTHMWRLDRAGPWAIWLDRIAQGDLLVGGALSESASWNAAMFPQATARRVAGGYRVDGNRSFCTGSTALDLFQCTAQVVDEAGKQSCVYFLITPDDSGVEFKDDWHTLGMRGSHSQGLYLRDVFVPDSSVLYSYAYGALDFSQIWLSFLAWSFVGFAAVYSGIAAAARDFAVGLIAGRSRAPGSHSLAHKPSNQLRAADMDALNLTMRAVREDVAGRYPISAPATIQTIIETAIAKHVCVTKAIEVVDHAMAMVGGQAYFEKLPLERMWRDVRAGPYHPFSTDDAPEMLGKLAFGIPFLEPGGWAL